MSPMVDTTVSMRLCSTMSMRDYKSKRDPQDAHDRSIVVIIHNTIHVHNIHTSDGTVNSCTVRFIAYSNRYKITINSK